ncbi:MAG: V-type ATPase subunit [Kiritimatiellae bacterium]|nr:V-type ATPase subunit [Kiritimatiellia bacterium]
MRLATYAAPGVRACALRSTLLRPAEWRSLAEAESAAAVLDWMRRRGVIGGDGGDLVLAERAAHDAVIRSASALLRFAKGSLFRLLRFFVWAYDLLNLEQAVRCIHFASGEPPQAGPMFRTGRFGMLLSAELASVTNYAAVARLLRGTPLARPFHAGLLRYREDEDVVRLVEALDAALCAEWVGAARSCGFRVRDRTDGRGLSVFLAARVLEAAVRLKVHRRAESSRVIEWLSLVAEGGTLEACLSALDTENAETAGGRLADLLLPAAGPFFAVSSSARLQHVVLRHAARAGRGITFDADFLTGFLVLQTVQARELTVWLESKDADLPIEGCSVYSEHRA